jgi:hypothetical protein
MSQRVTRNTPTQFIKINNIKEDSKNVIWLRNRVKTLMKKPQNAQRSPEWYKDRNTKITGSEIAYCLMTTPEVCQIYLDTYNIDKTKFKFNPNKSLSHFDTKEEYIIKKCASFFGENVFRDSVYTLWGKKYENIATRLYRQEYKTDVLEFGFLSHSRLNWLGMSPDGITPDGIMLEIKCPFSRKITEGIPPLWYWVQCQLQLECADLEECHFLECEITEFPSEEEYLQQNIQPKQQKGILINKLDEPDNSEEKYIYPPDDLITEQDFLNWANQYDANVYQRLYFFIHKWNVTIIYRSREWFNTIKEDIRQTHKFIRSLQEDKELFLKYKESIFQLKNKEYLEKYHNTECLIQTDIESEGEDDRNFDNQMDFEYENKKSDSQQSLITKLDKTICMINSDHSDHSDHSDNSRRSKRSRKSHHSVECMIGSDSSNN